jgi:hypothetical protein
MIGDYAWQHTGCVSHVPMVDRADSHIALGKDPAGVGVAGRMRSRSLFHITTVARAPFEFPERRDVKFGAAFPKNAVRCSGWSKA